MVYGFSFQRFHGLSYLAAIALLVVACTGASKLSTRTTGLDFTKPIPGNDGLMDTGSLNASEVHISWKSGTDDSSKPEQLKYRLKWSSKSDLRLFDLLLAEQYKSETIVGKDSFTISKLTPETTYTVKLSVIDEAGNSADYDPIEVTTERDNEGPVVGGSGAISLSALADSSVVIAWQNAKDNASEPESISYKVLVSETADLLDVSSIEANATSKSDYLKNTSSVSIVDLDPGTTYYVWVIAKDTFGNKTLYQRSSFTTATSSTVSSDTTPPVAGSGGVISSSSTTSSGTTLTWSLGSDETTATSNLTYLVFKSLSNNISTVQDAKANGTAIGAHTANINTATISALNDVTSYYFVVIVKDQAGNETVYQTINITTLSDTTAPTPGGTGVISTSSVSTTSLSLSWSLASDVHSPSLSYVVYQSSTNNINSLANAEANGVALGAAANDITSKSVSGLVPSTTYYFNLVVMDAAGNKVAYTSVSATTLADTTPPIPGASGATSFSSTTTSGTTISWTTGTDDYASASSLEYLVYYSTSNNMSSVTTTKANGSIVGAYAANISSKVVSGLQANTSYYFAVLIKDPAGNEAMYQVQSQSTLADTTAPTPGSSGSVSTSLVTANGLRLSWTIATDDISASAAIQYLAYRSTSNNMTTVNAAETNGTAMGAYATNISFVDFSGLTYNSTYYFTLIARDAAGNKAIYQTATATTSNDTVAPTPGSTGTVSTSSVATTSLTLSWTAATDDQIAGSSLEYLVYQSTTNNMTNLSLAESNGTAVGVYTANITTKNITSLTYNTSYYFTVVVRDIAGNKAVYQTANVTTANDTTAPTPGSTGTISESSTTTTGTTLNWTAATDDLASSANLSYLAFVSNSNNMSSVANTNSNGTAIGAYAANITTKAVSGLNAGSTYYFTVLVKDLAGNEAVYQTISITTTSDTTPPVAGSSGAVTVTNNNSTSLNLSWTKSTDAVTAQSSIQYLAYSSTSNNMASVSAAETNGTAAGSYASDIDTKTVTGLTTGTLYYFTVIAKDLAGNKVVYQTSSGTPLGDYVATMQGLSPIVYYPLNDSSGSVAQEDLDSSMDATLSNSPALAQVGPFTGSTAIQFNSASNQYADGTLNSINLQNSNFTISAWAKFSDLQNSLVFSIYHYHTTNGYTEQIYFGVYNQGANNPRFEFGRHNSASWQKAISAQAVKPNRWYHLTGTYDGSNVKLYIDGTLDGSAATSGNPSDTSVGIRIGKSRYTGATDNLKGSVAHIGVFNRVLNSTEITSISSLPSGTTRTLPTQTGYHATVANLYPFYYYKNTEASGATAMTDLISGSALATFANSPTPDSTGPFTGYKSLDFQEADQDRAEHTTVSKINFNTDAFSAAMWAKFDVINDNILFSAGGTTGDFATLGIWSTLGTTTKLVFGMINGSWTKISWTTTPTAGTWYHIAAVYNKSAMFLYVDGSQVATVSYSSGLQGAVTKIRFGQAYWNSEGPLDGAMSNIAFFNYALSPTEVSALATPPP